MADPNSEIGLRMRNDLHENNHTVTNLWPLFAYDSVWALARSLHAADDLGGDLSNATTVMSQMRSLSFPGATGPVRFDANADRKAQYELIEFSASEAPVQSIGVDRSLEGADRKVVR